MYHRSHCSSNAPVNHGLIQLRLGQQTRILIAHDGSLRLSEYLYALSEIDRTSSNTRRYTPIDTRRCRTRKADRGVAVGSRMANEQADGQVYGISAAVACAFRIQLLRNDQLMWCQARMDGHLSTNDNGWSENIPRHDRSTAHAGSLYSSNCC